MSADSFHEFVRELFAGLGRVQVKRMFGGAGVYAEGVMFALLAQETIYIKVDDALKAELHDEGGAPFVWTPKSGPRQGEQVDMGYWSLPDAGLDDPEVAAVWGAKALRVALARKSAKPPVKRKRPQKSG